MLGTVETVEITKTIDPRTPESSLKPSPVFIIITAVA